MLTYGSAFERELSKLIHARVESLINNLSNGYAIDRIETYREQVGKISGLREALELFEEANDIVSKRERGI